MFWASGSFWDAVPTLTPQEEIMRVVRVCEHCHCKPVIIT